ncbi:transporter [Variovorax arabinosiphilus]|uniref:transporter n=1 Tax=Variovorax arabinosiphilus TaxID=3053498 RepID=UPI002578647B|nr:MULTISPECIES: transporter [unclassified Variovorax]MDM0118406.1 transporter [Variovorax sp. J2L1-78]MDM0128831.1 transporter [Variovorax sp. J2L1-63]MDM0233383.1 transporter [Variovorax sp. J2R1-6]
MKSKSRHFFFGSSATAIALAAGLFLSPLTASAIDVEGGDYTALPDGANAFVVYGQYARRNVSYVNGDKSAASPRLDSEVGIARYLHVMRINDRWTVDPQVLLPFGHLKPSRDLSALDSTSGVGDLILATAFKYKIDPAAGEVFGVTPYLYLPTGSYDSNKALNLGENRWKFALQAAYTRPLAKQWRMDAIGDVTFYGKNTECAAACGSVSDTTLRQRPLYSGQLYLRYEPTASWSAAIGVTHAWGAESRVDGTSLDDRTGTTAIKLTASTFISSNLQLMATVARDVRVRNGLREDARLNLRAFYLF